MEPTVAQSIAQFRAEQLPKRIREAIETMSRDYGLQAFDMTYRDALDQVTNVSWDGQNPPAFTPSNKPPQPPLNMAKRFIDTELFHKQFTKSLRAEHKLLWIYLFTECNHAGIWEVELEVAGLRLGCQFDQATVLEAFGAKIHTFDNGSKWFIPDFLAYQYGPLNPAVKLHGSVIAMLSKYGLPYQVKDGALNPSGNSSQTVTVTVKDKDKDKDKDKEINRVEVQEEGASEFGGPSQAQFLEACRQLNPAIPAPHGQALWLQLEANGWLDGAGRSLKPNWRKKLAQPDYRQWAAKLDLAQRESPKPAVRQPMDPPRNLLEAAWKALDRGETCPLWGDIRFNTGRINQLIAAHEPFAAFMASAR